MNNNEIISKNLLMLILDGKVQPDEDIHTYAGWKARGYKVKRGEHAVTSFTIWKGVNKNVEVENEAGSSETVSTVRMFPKTASWFSTRQVEKV